MLGTNNDNNDNNENISSMLGTNTDSSAPQSSLDRINLGLPSSFDSIPGEWLKFEKKFKFQKISKNLTIQKNHPGTPIFIW